ncbi:MAG: 23S rRNA (pseudouridine(1915)-N(3))-methyltransferase RlmH [Clostridia bacterium]|nr:23S rRNA (pseudouridine(1915)-N(3))-methyltransferase RlmH [Clostridia bacterium]
MKVTVISVGKLKEKYIKDGINEYVKRLSRFCDIEMVEVEDEQAPDNLSAAQEQQVKKKEADKILKRVKDGSTVIVLDVKGERMTSEVFASKLNSFFVSGTSHITFIIGGSLGLDPSLISVARLRFSMSDLTFPHQLARFILMEQLYRAFKIMNNETYHK